MKVIASLLATVGISAHLAMCAPLHTSGCRHNWCVSGVSDETATARVTIAVKLQNMGELEEYLLNISDPSSKNYGAFLTLEEVHSLTSSPASAISVLHWLHTAGVEAIATKGMDFIRAKIPVEKAKRLFQLESFLEYEHVKSGKKVHRASGNIDLPSHIRDHVDFVTGLTDLPSNMIVGPKLSPKIIRLGAMREAESDAPADLQTIFDTYKISQATSIHPKSSQSVVEALGQQYSETDLKMFLKKFGAAQQKVKKVIGNNDGSVCFKNPDSCGEANLDVQTMLGIAQGIPMTYYSMPADDQDPFYDWMVELSQNSNPPLVHSVSYGEVENNSQAADSNTRTNAEFIKAGARGLTITVATGDDGVANYIARKDAAMCGFNPSFPASSPYVLAIGATQFEGGVRGGEEIAQSASNSPNGGITVGGGFSSQFSRPSWQQDAVSDYLNSADLPDVPHYSSEAPSKGFNIKGRAYPDVAALGHKFPVAIGGNFQYVDGTSAASPVVAAMLALVNNERLLAGKPPLGFVNPLIYSLAKSNPEIFNDVVQGSNNCAAFNPPNNVCCDEGFTATQGWDPLSGLGTINYDKFLEAAMSA